MFCCSATRLTASRAAPAEVGAVHGVFEGRVVAEDLAVAQADDAVGDSGDFLFVGDHDDGLALVVQLLEEA